MPRGKAKETPAGYRAQKVASVPGQRYGEGIEQQQMQQQMPAANMQASAPTTVAPAPLMQQPGAAGTPPGLGSPAPTGPDLAALMGQMPVGLLNGTQRPNEPITAGLSTGPGPGRDALGMRATSPMRRMLDQLSLQSGDPYFRELADRARL